MIFQQAAEDLIVENDRVVGAVTQMGAQIPRESGGADRRGTFLDGALYIGLITTAAVVLAIRHPSRCLAVCVSFRYARALRAA